MRRLRLADGVVEGLCRLSRAGYSLILASNEPDVALGFVEEHDARRMALNVAALLADQGVSVPGVYYCPHLAGGLVPRYRITCMCRKPSPGMLLRAAREHNLDLARSWIIGDLACDMEAGDRAGCRSILVEAGRESRWHPELLRQPDFVVLDMLAAAETVLRVDAPAGEGAAALGDLRPTRGSPVNAEDRDFVVAPRRSQ